MTHERIKALQERIAFGAWLAGKMAELPISESEFCRDHGISRVYFNRVRHGRIVAGKAFMAQVIAALNAEGQSR